MEWISVKVKLPEDYEKVLTCDCKGNIHIMYHFHGYEKPFNINKNNNRYYMIKYWQPLPKPYKKG